jgi:hypothetical protein
MNLQTVQHAMIKRARDLYAEEDDDFWAAMDERIEKAVQGAKQQGVQVGNNFKVEQTSQNGQPVSTQVNGTPVSPAPQVKPTTPPKPATSAVQPQFQSTQPKQTRKPDNNVKNVEGFRQL